MFKLLIFVILVFPQLYCYMINQRKKVLCRPQKSEWDFSRPQPPHDELLYWATEVPLIS